jgi:CHAD domain-containing protein
MVPTGVETLIMASTHTEVERKYDAADDADLPPLDRLANVDRIDTGQEELEATYFDTPGLDLAAAGVTLRRRTGGSDAGWHLKLPGGPDERLELQLPLQRSVKTPPKPFRESVRVHTMGRTLKQVATVRTHRTEHRLLDSTAHVLATVCDDKVRAHTPPPHDTGLMTAWREWEVELGNGSVDLLDAADTILREAGAAPAESRSKLARVLGDRVPTAPEPTRRQHLGDPAAGVVHARLREQLTEMKRQDPRVRHDLPEAVHDMRVAMRRLRTALATFRPLLDRTVTEPLREELKWVGHVLGEARDSEVIHQRLAEAVAQEPVELLLGPVVTRIDTDLGRAYREAHERSVEAMRSDRYFALVDRLDALLADPPWTPVAQEPAHEVLPRRMRKDWKRVRARVAVAHEAPSASARDERLHEVRKAAKRARYAAEALTPLYGGEAKRFAKAVKRVQSVLGDHQDSVVTQTVLRRLGVQAHLAGENGFSFGRLHGVEQANADSTRTEFETAWTKASRKKKRRWFG